MAKKLYIGFVLDETGSMISVKQQTIAGFNECIENLKKDKANVEVLFTLAKFNSEKYELVYSNVALDFVGKLTDQNYRPDAYTPLYDAIAKTINSYGNVEGKKKQHVLLIIQTDGLENASKEYNQKTVFDMIKEKKDKGWSFMFLGADQDAFIASERIGISRGSTMSYNSADTQQTIGRGVAMAAAFYTQTGGKQTEDIVVESQTKKGDEE